jgi:hypothetical protein
MQNTNLRHRFGGLNRFRGASFETSGDKAVVKVLVIEYCDLKFVCNLVLGFWDFMNLAPVDCDV